MSSTPSRFARPLWEQLMDRCQHFNGTASDVCDAGWAYADVRDTSAMPYRLPCFRDDGVTGLCPTAKFLSEAEAKAEEERIRGESRKFWAAVHRGECPQHGAGVTLRKVGRCVYAYPCGCRLYQGDVPKPATEVSP